VTLGQRWRRAVELVFGVAVGLMVADLLVILIGTGAARIGVVGSSRWRRPCSSALGRCW
jgi:uncharacterized membrane protein YgaE (UPF0421/DUF939 family)